MVMAMVTVWHSALLTRMAAQTRVPLSMEKEKEMEKDKLDLEREKKKLIEEIKQVRKEEIVQPKRKNVAPRFS